jgi:transposase
VVGIVERLVPDELWELFQRVAPEAPTRPQGGGRRRRGDREVLCQRPDSQALIPLVKGIPPVRSRRGPRRRRPGKLHADKGYDYAHLRRWLSKRGIGHRVARRGVETSQRLGRHRWTIERTMSWLAGCRRLHRRYERKAEHFLAFTSIACTLICYRRLAC